MRCILILGACTGAVVLLVGMGGCPGSVPSVGNPQSDSGNAKDPDPTASNVFMLRVARHSDQPLLDEDVDEVFAEASRLLQTVQTECPDVATDVTFLRSDTVETFDVGEAVITTERYPNGLDAVFDLPQDIKVVHALVGVCGVDEPADVATILGCATFGGSVVIVASAPPDVWAHEWGHVLGLGHRDDCRRNMMHSYEIDTNAVNQQERRAFLTPAPRAKALKITAPERSAPCTERLRRSKDEPADTWVDRVVRRRYLAGIPHELTGDCDTEALVRLRDWRTGDTPEHSLRNVIRLLGLAGDADACDLLIAQVLERTGELSSDQFNAVAEAFLALGRLVEHDSGDSALRFLIEGTDPRRWEQCGVEWSFATYSGERLHRLLARLSILALGLSDSETALDHLRALRQRIDDGTLVADPFADQVDEAIARLEGAAAGEDARSDRPRRIR